MAYICDAGTNIAKNIIFLIEVELTYAYLCYIYKDVLAGGIAV